LSFSHETSQDAVILGGGFYGVAIAIYLAKQRNFKRVVILEKELDLLKRASFNNQARVHNGYHYPRSFTTAFRSRINLPKFVCEWPNAIERNFTKIYAIARQNSKVSPRQFVRFCAEIGARIELADSRLKSLFNPRLIEEVFLVEEYAFDAAELRHLAYKELSELGIEVQTGVNVRGVFKGVGGTLKVLSENSNGQASEYVARYVFNSTYSGINQIGGDFSGTSVPLKHEITEMALMEVPPVLRGLGITVMDGPFFSLMPFPSRSLHTLSHVRYTPHLSWVDSKGKNPYKKLDEYRGGSRVNRMMRDVERYLPSIATSKYVESLTEIKTVLLKNEGDDGRPILFEKNFALPGFYSILGGKIDNIYDILEKLDDEELL